MRFEILDSARAGRKVSRPQDYYLNGVGQLFYDCDPTGVDMSGKRRIVAVDSNRFTVEAHSAAPNSDYAAALGDLKLWIDSNVFLSESGVQLTRIYERLNPPKAADCA